MIDKGSACQRFDGQKELPCIVISAGARGPLHGNGLLATNPTVSHCYLASQEQGHRFRRHLAIEIRARQGP